MFIPINLESINNGGDGDELHLWDISLGLFESGFVKEDSHICLFSDSSVNLENL